MAKATLYLAILLVFSCSLVVAQSLRINIPNAVDATVGIRGFDFNTPIMKLTNENDIPLLTANHQGKLIIGDAPDLGQLTIKNGAIATGNGIFVNNPNGFGASYLHFKNQALASKLWQVEAFTFTNNPSAYLNISHTDQGSVLFLTGNRQVGIGTTSPTAVLTVAGNMRWSGQLKLNNNGGNNGDILTINNTTLLPQWKKPTALQTNNTTALYTPIDGFVNNTVLNGEYTIATIPVDVDTTKGVLEYEFSFPVTSTGFARAVVAVALLKVGQSPGQLNSNQFHFSVDANRINTAAYASHFDLRQFTVGSYTLQLKLHYEEGPPIYFGTSHIADSSNSDYFFQYKFIK
jgi:hypothetical protein